MKDLTFTVKDLTLARKSGEKSMLISGSNEYFRFVFEFDEEFEGIPGTKSVEFFKNRTRQRVDLGGDNTCIVPSNFLEDRNSLEIRVIAGQTVATPWVSVQIVESGVIDPENPDEEEPSGGTGYVKSPTGDSQVAQVRKGEGGGLEFSQNGSEFASVIGNPRPVNALTEEETEDGVGKKLNEVIKALVDKGILTNSSMAPISEVIASVPTGDVTFAGSEGHKLSDLTDGDVEIHEDGSVLGNFSYISGWKWFSSNTEEQSGNFFAIQLGSEWDGKEITVKKNGGDPGKKSTDHDWILRLSNGVNTTFEFSAEGVTPLELSFKGSALIPVGLPDKDASPKDAGGKKTSDLISEDAKIGADGKVTGTIHKQKSMASFGNKDGYFFPVVLDGNYKSKSVTVTGVNGPHSGTDSDWLIEITDKNTTVKFEADSKEFFNLSFEDVVFDDSTGSGE